MPFIAIFNLLPKFWTLSGGMGRGIGGERSSGILLTMQSWPLNSHSVSFQHASSSMCINILLFFSRIQLIFRISSDQVETSIPSLPENVTSFRFIAVASRSVYCYQIRTSSLIYVPVGVPYPSGYSLPLLCSASFLALALVHVLSVALLRPVSSILLSFAGDASPPVFSSSVLPSSAEVL